MTRGGSEGLVGLAVTLRGERFQEMNTGMSGKHSLQCLQCLHDLRTDIDRIAPDSSIASSRSRCERELTLTLTSSERLNRPLGCSEIISDSYDIRFDIPPISSNPIRSTSVARQGTMAPDSPSCRVGA
jgi:hypothetical protein